MFNKMLKYMFVMLAAATLFRVHPIPVFTQEVGSVLINISHEEDVDGTRYQIPVSGISFSVYQIWENDFADPEQPQMLFNEPFKTVKEITPDMTEDEIQKLADDYAAVIDEADLYMTTPESDEDGTIFLNNMKVGTYLFVMNHKVNQNGVAYQIAPFLVSVPREIDGTWVYDVDASPKLSIQENTPPPMDKEVNGKKEYELNEWAEVVTYTLKTAIPVAASEFRVMDTLEPVLEFAPHNTMDELVGVYIGEYHLTPEEINAQVKIEGQTLTVEFTPEQLAEYEEEEVIIAFGAKLREGADLTPYEYGKVPNKCKYVINNEYEVESDEVPITPPPFEPPPTAVKTMINIFMYIVIASGIILIGEKLFWKKREN